MKATTRILAGLLACLAAGCDAPPGTVKRLDEGGRLVVVTTNGPATWYEDSQGRAAGFEFDLVTLFAKEAGLEADFKVVESREKAEKAVTERQAHIAASLLPLHFDLPGGSAWGPPYHSAQVQLVYRASDPKPKDLADLAGRRVAAIADPFTEAALAAPLRDAPAIARWPADVTVEELLEAIGAGRIDAAVVDSARFTVARKHFPQVEVAFDIGKPTQYAWRVGGTDQKILLDRMKGFFARIQKDGTLKRLADRHFAHAARISAVDAGTLIERINTILPGLKPHFLEAEAVSGYDWRLIAAIGYQESHWDALATSPTGVRGLMMLTEDTADRVRVKDRLDARESILGGARYLRLVADILPPRIEEPDRTFLALAAYNLGIGHLEDARILAQRRGLSPDRWQDVRLALPALADPAQYGGLKHGFARGHEAMQFVDNVRNYEDILARIEPREKPLPPRPVPAPTPAPAQGSTRTSPNPAR
jgi:membrane-bound lytic murein transglycosylase F